MSLTLSIITINLNNAEGLLLTLDSVARQTCRDIEHIIIDGASADNSVDVIRQYDTANRSTAQPLSVLWLSEPDKGIYNAMNKGIRMAHGGYIQILNSGDRLAADDVTERMLHALNEHNRPDILYGNMIKLYPNGEKIDTGGGALYNTQSFLYFYKGTLNHNCAYIRKTLFDKFGLYDEEMKICSDWKWYVDAIALGGVQPIYTNINVTYFNMDGISESGGKNAELISRERRNYLEHILPPAILSDYDQFSFPVLQYQRLRKHHLWSVVSFVERVLFKLEKWHILR